MTSGERERERERERDRETEREERQTDRDRERSRIVWGRVSKRNQTLRRGIPFTFSQLQVLGPSVFAKFGLVTVSDTNNESHRPGVSYSAPK